MSNSELKTKLSTLLNENPETFVETLNLVFTEEWLKDQEGELLMVNVYPANLITLLKNRTEKEIGEKYVNNPAKLATLLDAFIEMEVIEKGTEEAKIKELENNSKVLEGLKEIVKVFDKEGSW